MRTKKCSPPPLPPPPPPPPFSFISPIKSRTKLERKRCSWVVDWFDYLEVEIETLLCCTAYTVHLCIYVLYIYPISIYLYINVSVMYTALLLITYICTVCMPNNNTISQRQRHKQQEQSSSKNLKCVTQHSTAEAQSELLRMRTPLARSLFLSSSLVSNVEGKAEVVKL